jgi:Cu-Zn family superoxide dismutase
MTRFPRRALTFTAGALLLSLAACSREAEAPANDEAIANEEVANDISSNDAMMPGNAVAGQSFALADAAGKSLGSVSVGEGAGGLTLTVTASGMPAGTHGIHLHEKGLCDGPKFESAGKHWNPASKQHGRDNPQGAHLGDLANLTVGGDGTATASFTVAGAAMASGANMLADADGTSLVVHAKPDDYKTDPSGNSGDRIACAVLAAPK